MNIYKFIILGLLFLSLACEKPETINTGIIPEPTVINYHEGDFLINQNTLIVSDTTEEGQKLAKELNSFLKLNFNLSLKVSTHDKINSIKFI